MNYFKYFKKAYLANKSAGDGVLSLLKFFLYYVKYGYSIREILFQHVRFCCFIKNSMICSWRET